MPISKSKSPLWLIPLLLVLFAFFPFVKTISAQDQGQTPDFIVTLALMAVADDRLDGVMDTADLSNLRALVDDYYTQKSYLRMDEDTGTAMSDQRQLILSALDKKIDNQKSLTHRANVGLFVAMADSTNEMYQKDPDLWGDPYDLYNAALSSGVEPDPALKDLLQQRLAGDTQAAVQRGLDGHVAATIENGDQVVTQSGDAVYDFDAGLSTAAKEPEEIVLKPLIFTNMGFTDVRVLIEYYEPPIGLAVSAPGMNVQVPGESSVILEGFPQGNYVFCLDWLTDLDTDNDGLRDYDRAVIHGWISSAHTDDIALTREVYVNASHSSTPSGQCDGFKGEAPEYETVMTEVFMTESDPQGMAAAEPPEDGSEGGESQEETAPPSDADFWGQDDGPSGDDEAPTEPSPNEAPSGLTAAEMANQGPHNYAMTCQNGDMTDTRSFAATWEFTSDGVMLNAENYYARVSANYYQNEYGTTITFIGNGYLANSFYSETNSEGETTTTETICTATIQ